MSEKNHRIENLSLENIRDIICCPGGSELDGKKFYGDISRSLRWRENMLKKGMEGYIMYRDGMSVGFLEYMPAEVVPIPIEASGSAVIMCFHYFDPDDQKEEGYHHQVEKHLLRHAIKNIREDFVGVTTLAWDHPVHFPIDLFEDVGFFVVRSLDYISLMWFPFRDDAERPSTIGPNFKPSDISYEDRLSIECGYSSRCVYSIHDYNKVKKVISKLDDERIDFKGYRLDTREEVIEFSKEPWTWNWLFLNGDEIDHMKKNTDELEKIIKKKLRGLDR